MREQTQREYDEFVRTSLEASIYCAPRAHGLTKAEILQVGKRAQRGMGALKDAILRAEHAAAIENNGEFLQLARDPHIKCARFTLGRFTPVDPRNSHALNFPLWFLDKLYEEHGAGGASATRDDMLTEAKTQRINEHDLDVTLAILERGHYLIESGGLYTRDPSREAFPMPTSQLNQNGMQHHERKLLAEVYPIVQEVIAERGTPPRSNTPESVQARLESDSPDPLGIAGRELASPAVTREAANNFPRIFVSHSSRDADTARMLVDLLRKVLDLHAAEIRCTSVDGYRLPGGADTNAQLREEVNEATLLLGIISAQSLRSLYVVFELGARWGSSKPFIPLLAPGTPTSTLSGPLSGINALRLDNEAQVHQLLTETAAHLNCDIEPPASYSASLREFSNVMDQRQLQSITTALTARNSPRVRDEASNDISEEPGLIKVKLRLASHYFSTDAERDVCTLNDCAILVCAAEISGVQDLLPLLEQVARARHPLLVLAREVTGEALATLIKNSQLGVLNVCAVSTASSAQPSRIERLIAIRTGATVFNDEAARSILNARLSDLGKAARIEVVDATLSVVLQHGETT